MTAKRGRHLIRAILFIVRLRRDVQSAHRRRTTRRRMGALAKTAAMLRQNSGGGGCSPNKMKDRPPLTRCESSRRPRHELLRQSQHRNSAPSTIYPAPISPSPQPLNNFEEGEVEESNSEFESFLQMPSPYQQLQKEIYSSKAHKFAVNSIKNEKTNNVNEEEDSEKLLEEKRERNDENESKITGWLDPQELTDLLEKVEIHKLGSDWQNLFPSTSNACNKRSKNGNINGNNTTAGLRQLFSAGAKLIKNVQRGLYLATLFYTENGRILCTVDDCLPVICVDENFTGNGLNPDEFHWLLKLSLCWNQLKQLQNALLNCNTASANCSIRIRLLEAASAMHNALGVKDIGRLHYVPLQPRPGTHILVTVRLLLTKDNDVVLAAQGLALRWMRLAKFLIRRQGCSVMESLKHEMLPILNFYESSLISLKPGLYLAYLKLQSSLNCVNVLIPENFTSILPFAKIRSNNFLTQQEWMFLQSLNCNNNGIIIKKEKSEQQQIFTEEQINFQKQLASAAKNLTIDLDLNKTQISTTRIFFHRLVRLNNQVLLILAMPRPEEVCPIINNYSSTPVRGINNGNNNWTNNLLNLKNENINNCSPLQQQQQFRGCLSMPVSVFQIVNMFAYQPKLLSTYCHLSVFLDHFLILLQYEQRACLDQTTAFLYSEQLKILGQFQKNLDKCWRSVRWISDFASIARERAYLNR
uniref:Uncharacterized protein n=1 Tax=Meloidogyne enterolobii TaxID=390850 RepID=A0A6V7TJM3_MELEN|nr:unnamed protein product [Meloidogyne enterolobii]